LLLRINIWISFKGLQRNDKFNGLSFPYVAKQPSSGKKVEYGDISDIYDEIIKLSNEAEQKGFNVGEAIYTQSFFFVDHELLLDSNMQDRIKEYQFCKTFSCPPYPSLQETPPNIIDDFTIIEQEINHCMNKKQQEKVNA